MEAMKIRNLYNLEETIAAPLLEQYEYPWEVLPHIKEFIKALGRITDNCAFSDDCAASDKRAMSDFRFLIHDTGTV